MFKNKKKIDLDSFNLSKNLCLNNFNQNEISLKNNSNHNLLLPDITEKKKFSFNMILNNDSNLSFPQFDKRIFASTIKNESNISETGESPKINNSSNDFIIPQINSILPKFNNYKFTQNLLKKRNFLESDPIECKNNNLIKNNSCHSYQRKRIFSDFFGILKNKEDSIEQDSIKLFDKNWNALNSNNNSLNQNNDSLRSPKKSININLEKNSQVFHMIDKNSHKDTLIIPLKNVLYNNIQNKINNLEKDLIDFYKNSCLNDQCKEDLTLIMEKHFNNSQDKDNDKFVKKFSK